MATITLRSVKGAPLTSIEVDNNFSNINTELGQKLSSSSTVTIANGGTNGTASPTSGAVAYGTGTAYAFTSAGTAGQVLTSNGGAAPTWAVAAAGATGGSTDQIFWENGQTTTANYTISAGKNAGTFGPVAVNSGVVVTVPSGSVWTIV
jgi:hypothetical protein